MDESTAETDKEREIANARVGYQSAVMLWTYEGQRIWREFNAMLVANSIVIAVTGVGGRAAFDGVAYLEMLPIAGLVLCALWFLLARRGFTNHGYWILAARELEEKYLSPPVQTTARRDRWTAGEQILIELAGRRIPYRLGFFSRHIKAEIIAYFIIGVFAAVNLLFLITTIHAAAQMK